MLTSENECCLSTTNREYSEKKNSNASDRSRKFDLPITNLSNLCSCFRVLSRRLFKDELEKKWPKPEQRHDWDMWMRMESNKKGRECIIPDISRTFHFGAKGLNIGSMMQKVYFDTRALNTVMGVKFDVNKMYKDNYEKEMLRLIR